MKTLKDYVNEILDMSEEFIREYKEQIDWVELSNYKLLSKDFITGT